jgi:MinD-like ATPase involved in chromosome partitioning or flagellar assembly
VVYDGFVSSSINRRQSFMLTYPMSRCAKGIEKITENLMGQEQANVEAGGYAGRRL